MSFDVKKKIEELNKSDIISGSNARYDIVLEEELKDLNSAGIILRHKKSGARVVVISNDDNNKVFSIGFKTPPFNDTGMQHIIEHSTLCGSRKYPVKDPFVELCKGSLNTFLNAMTYPDKTVYPVASCNDTDFKNIMDVYMDAVFYPAMYEKPEIFMQEGWHYELDNADDDIKYNGVVFNEMKGAFSSPDDVLSRYTFVSLFPDTVYKNESGGDPEVIPTLKYEDFLKYHEEYYHPSNSYIYIYGDMDVNERLEYLDREYLSDFDVSDVDIHANIERQAAFDKPVYETKPYAITEDESLEDNTYLSYNAVIGTSVDAKLYLAFQILDYALVMTPGAPVKQALLDAGISTDVYSSYETSLYQPVYSIVAKNSNSKEQGRFVSVINDTLEKLVKDGINERTIEAGINYYEFKYREADYGPYPKGLMYYLTMMDSWLYDETKPFIHIEAGDTFDELKKDARNGYFEKLIKEYLLDNNHKSIISLVPEYGLEKEKEQKAAIVQEFKEGTKKLIVATKAFGMGVDISDIDRVYHVAPSSTFVDYIQEIGRAARDTEIQGIAATDYHERDFYYMKRLHQTGNIAQEQLVLILRKLMEVYRMKGEKPEIMVSLSDFEFVVKLPRTKNKLEYEAELGQLIKTALLWLEDDLMQRYGRHLLEISPKNLLTEGYVQDKTGDVFAREFHCYLTKVEGEDGVYVARLEALWEERFPELGYKEFKQKLNNGTLWEGARTVSVGKHEVLLKEDATVIRERMDALFKSLTMMLKTALIKSKGRFDEEELRAVFAEHGMDVRSAKRFIGSLLESRTEEGRSVSYISSVKKKDSNELSFTVTKGFDLLLSRYQKLFSQRIVGSKGDRLLFYCTPFSDLNMLLNLLSMLDCLSFSVEGGGTPCVFVRFNDPETLQELALGDDYRNLILDTNGQIFQEQIDLFSFFFGTDKLTDEQRWDFIEDYFTGMGVDDLKKKFVSL